MPQTPQATQPPQTPGQPRRYAVIGHPIAHSKSPHIHAMFARATGCAITYEAVDAGAHEGAFAQALSAFRAAGGLGVNVTLPFKLQALACADEASDDARLAGAANALRFDAGRVQAQNFDGIGLVRDITANLGCTLAGKRVLLLGAGGATRGALLPLARAKPACLHIANRTADKAQRLAQEMAAHLHGVPIAASGLQGLGGMAGFDVAINATSASLGGAALALPAHGLLADGALAYDMVYGKGQTPFLQWAQAAGAAQCADGAGMLVEQAAEAFHWWLGVRPDTCAALQWLRQGG